MGGGCGCNKSEFCCSNRSRSPNLYAVQKPSLNLQLGLRAFHQESYITIASARTLLGATSPRQCPHPCPSAGKAPDETSRPSKSTDGSMVSALGVLKLKLKVSIYMPAIWEFPKIRGTLFCCPSVLMIRILLFRVLYQGPLFSETPIWVISKGPGPMRAVGP